MTITGEDGESGVDKLYYFLGSSETVMDKDELAALPDSKWAELKEISFDLYPDNKYVVYAKIRDKSGNVTFVSSNGIVLDSAAPVIAGIENEKVYCSGVTFTVSDNWNLKFVKIDGRLVEMTDNGKYVIPAGDRKETHTIEAEDKAGNKILYRITINANGTPCFSDREEIKPGTSKEDGSGTNTESAVNTSDPTSMVFITFLRLLLLSSGTMAVMIMRRKLWMK